MKVKESDLKGDIKGFPIEVVQAMVNEQVRQGNKADVKVFQDYGVSDKRRGGFYWAGSAEQRPFWDEVINRLNFNMFFNKYPKQNDLTDSKIKQTQSTVEEYNKEKLHEYAKELFALCLDKGIVSEHYSEGKEFVLFLKRDCFKTFYGEESYLARSKKVFNEGVNIMPIWELIEKVKQL